MSIDAVQSVSRLELLTLNFVYSSFKPPRNSASCNDGTRSGTVFHRQSPLVARRIAVEIDPNHPVAVVNAVVVEVDPNRLVAAGHQLGYCQAFASRH